MRFLSLMALWLIGLGAYADAAIVFTLEQSVPGDIQIGNNAVFNLYIRSEPSIVSITGIDFAIDANDPTSLLDRTDGGQFLSGTSNYFPIAGSDPYQFDFPTSYAWFTGDSGAIGLDLGTADTLLATLTLGTMGAKTGIYTMGLSNLLAVNGFDPFEVSAASTSSLKYSLTTAIPEPNCALWMGLSWVGCLVWKRNRKRDCTDC